MSYILMTNLKTIFGYCGNLTTLLIYAVPIKVFRR